MHPVQTGTTPSMSVRKILITAVTIALVGIILLNATTILTTAPPSAPRIVALDNVRDYVVASAASDLYYAVDGGALYAGGPAKWVRLPTPPGIIINAVAVDVHSPDTLYFGAANEPALYRSSDGGQRWQRYALTADHISQSIGSITDIGVDSFQKLVYVGTDAGSVFRLRDTGSILVLGSHLLLNEPVREIVTDSTGSGLAFVRTTRHLYRSSQYGLKWTLVDNLGGIPTDIAISTLPPISILVGTANVGVLRSYDGRVWTTLASESVQVEQLPRRIDALAVDPLQPDLLYVATSKVFARESNNPNSVARSTITPSPIMVAQVDLYRQSTASWLKLATAVDASVTDLMPVSGQAGAVYALTANSRRLTPVRPAPTEVTSDTLVENILARRATPWAWPAIFAWIIASLAVVAFAFAIIVDLRQRRRRVTLDGPLLSPVRLLSD